MKEKFSQNPWVLKEKELLERLSLEISKDFSIWEKLAKKLIYKTHLSLKDLKNEIYLEQQNNDTNNIKYDFNDENLNKLLFILNSARKLIEKSSKQEILQLRNILENTSINLYDDPKIVKKIFPQKLLQIAKNPNNISQHIMWASLWIASSFVTITEVLYYFWKWIITSIPDIISILKWDAEIDSFRKI